MDQLVTVPLAVQSHVSALTAPIKLIIIQADESFQSHSPLASFSYNLRASSQSLIMTRGKPNVYEDKKSDSGQVVYRCAWCSSVNVHCFRLSSVDSNSFHYHSFKSESSSTKDWSWTYICCTICVFVLDLATSVESVVPICSGKMTESWRFLERWKTDIYLWVHGPINLTTD